MDTSTEPDMLPFRRISCLRNGKAAAGGSSGTVTVYDCRMLGMLTTGERLEPTGATRLVRRVSRSGGLAPGGLPLGWFGWTGLLLLSLGSRARVVQSPSSDVTHSEKSRRCEADLWLSFSPPFNPLRAELIEAAK